MNQEKKSLYQRIRNAKQSLENAEQSFLDDKGVRGELDLMLAEAELKNLRQKQTFPWSWNRQTLAFCVSLLLIISGFGGWYIAKGDVQKVETVSTVQPNTVPNVTPAEVKKTEVEEPRSVKDTVIQHNKIKTIDPEPLPKRADEPKVKLSPKDVRKLVRSAKTELSSGK